VGSEKKRTGGEKKRGEGRERGRRERLKLWEDYGNVENRRKGNEEIKSQKAGWASL